MISVKCGHPLHADRFGEPDWYDGVLLEHSKAGPVPLVVYCGGCAAADNRLRIDLTPEERAQEALAEIDALATIAQRVRDKLAQAEAEIK